MNGKERTRKTEARRQRTAAAVLAVLTASGALAAVPAPSTAATALEQEKQMATTQSKFFCNTKALTPAERARHKELSEKLLAARKATVETEKGYELQFGPKDISMAELTEWVVAESKCCPFFDFHIDLEETGSLLCLRLTGEEGIKAFIRSEFHVQ